MARGNGRETTALGVYRRASVGRGPSVAELERRAAAILRERGSLPMPVLDKALHFNVDQDRLHRAVANLRDAGAVEVRQERRFRPGRARVVVGPAEPDSLESELAWGSEVDSRHLVPRSAV